MESLDPTAACDLGKASEHTDEDRKVAIPIILDRFVRTLLPSMNTAKFLSSRYDVRYPLVGALIRKHCAMLLATPRASLSHRFGQPFGAVQFINVEQAGAVPGGFEIVHVWKTPGGFVRVEDLIVMGPTQMTESYQKPREPVCQRKLTLLDLDKQDRKLEGMACLIISNASHVYYIPTSNIPAPGPPQTYFSTSCQAGYDVPDPIAPPSPTHSAGSSGEDEDDEVINWSRFLLD